jgi:archaellum component FlaF (FlaF/FlaG flagellin family)
MRRTKSCCNTTNNSTIIFVAALIIFAILIYIMYNKNNNSIETFSNMEQTENDLKSQCKSCKVNVDMKSLS